MHLVICVIAGVMYWIDSYKKIEAAYLNGTGRTILLTKQNYVPEFCNALALHAGNIYIAEFDYENPYGYFFTLWNYPWQRESRNCWWVSSFLPFPAPFPSIPFHLILPSPLSPILFHFLSVHLPHCGSYTLAP